MDPEEAWFFARLQDRSASEADHISCIETLEVLLTEEWEMLKDVSMDASRSEFVRKRAASAVEALRPESS